MLNAVHQTSFTEPFPVLDDPRQGLEGHLPLEEILLPVPSGADDFVEISDRGWMRPDFLRRFFPLRRAFRAATCRNDVFNTLDAGRFQACFTAWVEDLRAGGEEIIAIDGKTSTSRRFYIASTTLPAERFSVAVRAHWGIENRFHWALDVIFHEDPARLRAEYAPQKMATVRHAAPNLIKAANDRAFLKLRRIERLGQQIALKPSSPRRHEDFR